MEPGDEVSQILDTTNIQCTCDDSFFAIAMQENCVRVWSLGSTKSGLGMSGS